MFPTRVFQVAGWWKTGRRFLYRRILHADDTPHRIALGVGLATFIGFLPIMGVQTLVALAVAAVLRANKAVCLPFVWITNAFTFVPIYWGCWKLGSVITQTGGPAAEQLVASKITRIHETLAASGLSGVFRYELWAQLAGLMAELGIELWIGCGLVGLVCGTVLYFFTRWSVEAYRARRQARRGRKIRSGSSATPTQPMRRLRREPAEPSC